MADVAQSLDELVPVTVDEHIAISDATLREQMTNKLIRLFVGSNIVVLLLVIVVFVADIIRNTSIINTNVIMALIGATTVQLGAIMVSISAYLFPKPS